MTLKELIEKLNKVPQYYGVETAGEVITDAWVAGENDVDYPEGAILFQCCSCNLKRTAIPEDFHVLSILPTKISKIN